MNYEEALKEAGELDIKSMDMSRKRWLSVAKPLFSLGTLERAVTKMAGIFGSELFSIEKKALVIMCADNGVVEEGVTQCGQEITAAVTENFHKGMASSCIMAKIAGADVVPIDVGVAVDVDGVSVPERKIMYGTDNMTKAPAMSREQAIRAVEVGINIVGELKEKGYGLLATGEMGIGNTTTSSAVASVLLEREVRDVTGRGAGLSSEGLEKKIDAIERAIALNKPDKNDALDVLSKVGGLDIAAIAGMFIGGAAYRIPIMIDGFISAAAALAAVRLCPNAHDFMIASHISKEPAGRMVLEALDLEHYIDCGMFLGEGTGAVAAMPLLDMAYAVYSKMSNFDEFGHESYKILK